MPLKYLKIVFFTVLSTRVISRRDLGHLQAGFFAQKLEGRSCWAPYFSGLEWYDMNRGQKSCRKIIQASDSQGAHWAPWFLDSGSFPEVDVVKGQYISQMFFRVSIVPISYKQRPWIESNGPLNPRQGEKIHEFWFCPSWVIARSPVS